MTAGTRVQGGHALVPTKSHCLLACPQGGVGVFETWCCKTLWGGHNACWCALLPCTPPFRHVCCAASVAAWCFTAASIDVVAGHGHGVPAQHKQWEGVELLAQGMASQMLAL